MENKKFSDPNITAKGEKRASVVLGALSTLWFNTGTLCNLSCNNCYIESSPRNDRLLYLTVEDVDVYLQEIKQHKLATQEIGFTGGEPFMNPSIIDILAVTLSQGMRVLVLTNAMKPMQRRKQELLTLQSKYPDQLTIRVSVDHYTQVLFDQERGKGAWEKMLVGLQWLIGHQFRVDIAGRLKWKETENEVRNGFAKFFAHKDIPLDAYDRKVLTLFPEMDANKDVPEITESCWDILKVDPASMMCASSRMIVRHKGEKHPSVMACTLLAYDRQFDLGRSLKTAQKRVQLNHRHCSSFCVLGGGTCSA
ncbi:MAG: radical SAM protein [Deltaproteobacteria bacterium]|nr:radical SAM protein [Deltaproteobacteria bacterium]